ncbi:FAD:protein FMN transferase [Roseivirga sp. E12]|uniref:FAD:protein FMN transferase n=1 Tax=Roseivirga sp. E12 TaxID=2819237 RepID=UPI001ABC3EFA|nr:FAD:protein FMN transferase [Roseivirga sp. E12]MBO3697490.1 FAD:protein FMN transferase [Roseivirga sp. E12]
MEHFEHDAMATQFTLTIEGESTEYAENASIQVFELIDQLELQLSRFIPDSDISRINRMKAGDQLPIDFEVWEVMKTAIEINQISQGAFDIGVARHMDIFRASKQGILNEFEMTNALEQVQTEKLAAGIFIDPEKPMAYCVKEGIQFDLGGIGKGYALDKCKLKLADLGIETFTLSAGDSTLLVSNNTDTKASWQYSIASSKDKMDLELSNVVVSASGTFYQGNHIFDPRTGNNQLSSAYHRLWVASESAAHSDAFSTALFLVSEGEIKEMMAESDKIIWVAYSKDGNLQFLSKNHIY